MGPIGSYVGEARSIASSDQLSALALSDPPEGISSILWALSSPEERAALTGSGATVSSNEEIVVTHPGLGDSLNRPGEGGGGNSGSVGGPGGSGGAQRPKKFANVPLTEAQEAKVEVLVTAFRDKVAADPRSSYMEAGAAILRLADGSFKLGPISWGSLRSVDIDYGQTVDITQVVGAIHSHPIAASVADNNYTHALNPSPNDWASAQQFKQSNGRFYREYIMGPDGNVRKYDFNSPPGQPGPVVAP